MAIKFKIAGQEYTVDGAAEEDTLLRIEAMFKKATNDTNSIFNPKAQNAYNKSLANSTKSLDDLNTSFDDLDVSVDDADKSFDDVVKNEKRREKQREDASQQFAKAIRTNFIATSQYFAHSIQDATQSFVSGLAHASGPEDGVLAFSRVIDTTINVVADGIKAVASAIPVIGGALAGITGAAAEAAKFANDFLAGQLTNIIQSYGKISSEGILLADGMTELKKAANDAGLGVAEYSDALSRNSELISKTGLGMTVAAEKFGVAFASLRTGSDQYSRKLFALGYSIQDQADIVAASMNNLSKTTNIQKLSGDQIAEQSYEYAKSLKVISDITGKSAKQQMEQQQAAQLNIAVQAKLAQLGPEAQEKFNSIIRVLPASMQQAAEQTLLFGRAMTGGAAILAAQNPQVAKALAYSTQVLTDSSVDAATAAKQQAGLYAEARDSLKTDPAAIAEATAGVANIGGTAGDVSNILTTLQTELQSYTKDGIVPAQEAETKLTTQTDSLTGRMSELADQVAKLKADIETEAMGAIDIYSNALVKSAGWISDLIDSSRGAINGAGPTNQGDWKGFMGDIEMVLDKVLGNANDPSNNPWAFGKSIADGIKSSLSATNIDPTATMQFADGGIASGSTNGYTATLHGTEAVVPLPNGNSIPVEFNSDDFTIDKQANIDAAGTSAVNLNGKILAAIEQLLNSTDSVDKNTQQSAGMSSMQGNLMRELVNQMSLNNDLLGKIYKSSY
jgi:predicted  nucleic acid-binding Zn-ribbon protein